MHKESSFERRDRRFRPPFRRRNRHPGLAEREAPRQIPKPKGEIPPAFAETVFGMVNPLLQHAVAEEGYLMPTPIQQQSIPHLLAGEDLLGCAQTGTGKTAAFLLPILHRLAATPKQMAHNHPRALVLAPTRELAAQIATSTATYGRYLGIPFAVVFGGVSQGPQVSALNRGAMLVVATPGRLLDLMEQGHVMLDAVEEFVLDEADRMLDMGFLPDIRRILSKLPEVRHSQFFSATLSPEVLRLAKDLVKDPVQVTISPEQPTVDKINQRIMFVDKPNKDSLLISFLTTHPEAAKVIVFARTRHGADRIERKLGQAGIRAEAIHSDKSQRARTEALDAFRSGHVRVLVATDIASRGIDVDGITHVVNFDLPEEPESYVHRIGRTARAGADGAAISFVSAEERGLLRGIERLIKKPIEVDNNHEFHSEKAEQAAGRRGGDGAFPPPPWVGKRQSRGGERRRDDRRQRPNGQGRRQADFGRGSSEGGWREESPHRRPDRSHSDGGNTPRREQGDGERPPRFDEVRGDRPPKQESGPRKPFGGGKPRFGHGGGHHHKSGEFKRRSSRPPWMQ